METEELAILTAEETREWIRANMAMDPAKVAFQYPGGGLPARLVASQIKTLQKAYQKLPSWTNAGCILPPRAYEQASSELSASLKKMRGMRCLDLTFGLGVDSANWAGQFEEVVALEPNASLVKIGRWNLAQMGISNLTVHHIDAESFLRTYDGPPFDLIYADPDRRNATEKRLVNMTQFAPNVVDLFPFIRKNCNNWWIKTSPLTDLTEAARLFPEAHLLTTVSIDRECREVWIQGGEAHAGPLKRRVLLSQSGVKHEYLFNFWENAPKGIISASPQFILEPDPGFYHSRTTEALLRHFEGKVHLENDHTGGYFFAESLPEMGFPGRVFEIKMAFAYAPSALKKVLKQLGIAQINVSKRNFPLKVEEIRKRLNLKEGGSDFLICTLFQGKEMAFLCTKK